MISVIALHGLGLDSRLFDPVAALLPDDIDMEAIDLPGFGTQAGVDDVELEHLVEATLLAVRDRRHERWLLVGHSMGGKVASLTAATMIESGDGPSGALLLAGSPPSPEPMSDDRRAEMLAWARSGAIDAEAARTFVDANLGAPLSADLDRLAVDAVRASSATAWVAWLERGSREDRAAEVGLLDVPVVLVAGGADGDLGEQAQRELNAPHYRDPAVEVLAGAGHLLPLERPAEVARLLVEVSRRTA